MTHDYLKYPHSQTDLGKIPLGQYNKYDSGGIKTNLSKAKEHLAELGMKNKQKHREEAEAKQLDNIAKDVLKGLTDDHFSQAVAKKGPLLPEEKQKKFVHPQAQEFKERMDQTKHLLKNLEMSQMHFKNEVNLAEAELNEIELKTDKLPPPTTQINQMLTKWGKEPVLTNDQIDTRAAELWKTKEQFEKELAADVEKSAVIINRVKNECHNKITRARE